MANLSTQESQEQFISDNIEHLARAAYAGYRDTGPGILVILPEGKGSNLGSLSVLQYHYMMVGELIDVVDTSSENPAFIHEVEKDIRNHIQEYDPSTSIVVSFLRRPIQPQELNLYRVECPTPPAAAYAAFVN